jgi:oligoribonuclease NrnB/cAMP/cGMP phosphodiesterase (DHH superfamily)
LAADKFATIHYKFQNPKSTLMRLVTRSDFDGLVCAVILKEVEKIDSIEFCHPKDVQDGKVKITSEDIVTNLPYQPECGMWFDHHASEAARNDMEGIQFAGRFEVAPSAARVVYDYYIEKGFGKQIKKYAKMMKEVDKSDAAILSKTDVTKPKGWILLSYVMDPRTGLGKHHDYAISNRELMFKLVDWIPHHTVSEIIKMPDVKARVDRYFEDEKEFAQILKKHSKLEKNVVITDLRGMENVPTGNRFLIYTIFPKANISVRIFDGKKGENVVVALGHSIFNRKSKTDVGKLMSKFGGGGHKGAGTCQLAIADADAKIKKIIAAIKKDG